MHNAVAALRLCIFTREFFQKDVLFVQSPPSVPSISFAIRERNYFINVPELLLLGDPAF